MPYISQDLTSPQKNHKRIGSVIAFVFSVLWIIVALDYLIRSDWLSQRYHLTPAEFIGGICGLFLPVVLAFLLGGYFDRGEQMASEAKALQAYLKGLVFPSAEGAVYTKAITSALREQILDFHNVLSELKRESQTVNTDMKTWSQNLDQLINHIDTKTVGAIKEMATHIQLLAKTTQEVTQQAQYASDLFSAQTSALEKVTSASVLSIENLSKTLAQNMNEITDRTHALENITLRTANALSQAKGVSSSLQTNTKQLEKIISSYKVANQEQTSDLLEQATKTANLFKSQDALLGQEFEKTIQRLNHVQEHFSQQAQNLYQTADEGIFHMNEVSALFDKKSKNLKETLEDFEQKFKHISQTLEKKEALLQQQIQIRPNFSLSDAKLVLDQLQNCSIDIAKIFSPKTQESLWSKYHMGDKGVFMRHIMNEISTQTGKKVRSLAQQNQAFKLAVSRYMSTFEEMTSQIGQSNEDSLTLSILLGSDVGRVYMILAEIFKKKI